MEGAQVSHQVALDVETLFAQVATERRLAGVRPTVDAERGSRGETFSAAVARVGAAHPGGGRRLQFASTHAEFFWHKFQSFLGFLDGAGCGGGWRGHSFGHLFLVRRLRPGRSEWLRHWGVDLQVSHPLCCVREYLVTLLALQRCGFIVVVKMFSNLKNNCNFGLNLYLNCLILRTLNLTKIWIHFCK